MLWGYNTSNETGALFKMEEIMNSFKYLSEEEGKFQFPA